jgi:hypothetical protein
MGAEEIVAFSSDHLAHFTSRTVLFRPLPKTSTGKIPKFMPRERAKQVESFATGRARNLAIPPPKAHRPASILTKETCPQNDTVTRATLY